MKDAAPILELRGIEKAFASPSGRAQVLHGIDLRVERGDFIGITGPSGSGKTTLLMLAALMSRPSGGTIIFDGEDVSGKDEAWLCRHRKYRVGMVFQKFCLLPHRTALENVLFRFRYLEQDPDEALARSKEALQAMGMGAKESQSARLLSSGEMQRVAIARAVALPPRLLVADEPTGNLDRESTLMVMDCLQRLNEDGLTILLVTHNEELLRYCSRHVVCRNGYLEEACAAGGGVVRSK